MFKHIFVPVDGSATSLGALEIAAQLAKEQAARMTVCTVADPAKAAAMAMGEASLTAACVKAFDEEASALVQDAVEYAQVTWPAHGVVLDGAVVASIVDYAQANHCDLIVMGSHGRNGLGRLFLGSVAEGVLRNATIPVLIVRQNAARTAINRDGIVYAHNVTV